MRNSLILSFFAAVFAVAYTSTISTVFAQGIGVAHVPHRAFYEIRIGRVEADSQIVDARGRMVAEWREACEGWSTNQRLVVSMAPGEGTPIESEVVLTAFERADGTEYNFESETRIGGETIEKVRGKAKRPGPGQPGKARYLAPIGTTVDLPADTVFPYEHTISVLNAAARGEVRSFNHYFDGSQPDMSPMEANALILGKPRAAEEETVSKFGAITDHKWWPVRLAMFDGRDHAAGSEEPEFEMTQLLQDNGVVRRFEFDYGEFTLIAALVKIDELDRPTCR